MQLEQITYRIVDSSVGNLVIGVTSKGCCLVEFEDRMKLSKIKQVLRNKFNAEFIEGKNNMLDQIELELKQYFKGNLQEFTIPLDIRGSPFQGKVWQELLKIPYGKTKSYSEIARSVNNPRAVRAVGKANGENHIAILIPCHRVIQHNGKLAGYGGGIWRKRALLDLEKSIELEDQETLDNYF